MAVASHGKEANPEKEMVCYRVSLHCVQLIFANNHLLSRAPQCKNLSDSPTALICRHRIPLPTI